MHLVLFLQLFAFSAVEGFILESNNNGGTVAVANGLCVTLAEFHSTIKQLHQENDELRHKMEQNRIESDKTLALLTSQLQIKFKELENNLTVFSNLKENYNISLENELSQTKSQIVLLDQKVDILENLKTVQQLQELNSLKQKIQSVEIQTHSLAVNEQARGQDFVALYNQTVDLKVRGNNRFFQLEQNISDIRETVAVTACAQNYLKYDTGSIIKFPSITTHIGKGTLDGFQSSGKFRCTTEGLYHLTVSILSLTVEGRFNIYHNGNSVYHTYISNSGRWEMSTAVLVINIKINDTVWVQSETKNLIVDTGGSCFTIVKVK